MKVFGTILSALITICLICFLNNPVEINKSPIPPLGKLLSPFTGFWQNAEPNTFQDETLRLPGITQPVKVVYDDRLVPHIFAQNLKDASYAQGYITAKYRLWQLDISTRAAGGRLAEVFGSKPKIIEHDLKQRRKGMLWAAEKTVKRWMDFKEEYSYIEAYTNGINDYISSLNPALYPLEFKLMDYAPEPWTSLKSALFVKSMSETLCGRHDDIPATNALNLLGEDVFDMIFPERNPKDSPIIPSEVEWDYFLPSNTDVEIEVEEQYGQIYHENQDQPDPFLGSNNWAVSGVKTKNGHPILCNDPHLKLTLPSIWFEVQINTPDQNAYGVSLPGLPGIIIGFNDDIAWGATNVGHDVLDYHRIKWANEEKTSYHFNKTVENVRFRRETIRVKGQRDIIDSVKYTIWGPMPFPDSETNSDLAMRWMAHDAPEGNEVSAFMGLNHAKNFDEYEQCLKNYDCPPQNFVFASRSGDIGLRVSGKFPLKNEGQGRFISEGTASAHGWKGFVSKSHVPISKNPSTNYIASANQVSTAPDYPYYYNGYFEDYRGRYLHEQLAGMSNITVEDMMMLQQSAYSLKAREALPLMLSGLVNQSLNSTQQAFLDPLKNWDYIYNGDKDEALRFELWFRSFYKLTWDEIYTMNETQPMLFPESWRTIALMQDDPTNAFFDIVATGDKSEVFSDVVFDALDQAIASWQEATDESSGLDWKQYRSTHIAHLARLPGMSSGLIESSGTGDALNAIKRETGPSWRMVVEMSDPIRAYGVYPGGQSGNPGSTFYDQMIAKWDQGGYYPLHFMPHSDALSEEILYTSNLNPAK